MQETGYLILLASAMLDVLDIKFLRKLIMFDILLRVISFLDRSKEFERIY